MIHSNLSSSSETTGRYLNAASIDVIEQHQMIPSCLETRRFLHLLELNEEGLDLRLLTFFWFDYSVKFFLPVLRSMRESISLVFWTREEYFMSCLLKDSFLHTFEADGDSLRRELSDGKCLFSGVVIDF